MPKTKAKVWKKQRELITIPITTRIPSKWRWIDLETGDVWMWDIRRAAFKTVDQFDDISDLIDRRQRESLSRQKTFYSPCSCETVYR